MAVESNDANTRPSIADALPDCAPIPGSAFGPALTAARASVGVGGIVYMTCRRHRRVGERPDHPLAGPDPTHG